MRPLLILLVLGAPAQLNAQACFRGRPLPDCPTFWITESGIAKRLNRNPYGASDDLLATFELGRMRNRAKGRTAIGGTLFVGVTDQASDGTNLLLGFKPRFRRWLSPSNSLELSPGAFLTAKDARVGVTGSAALNLGDWAALTGQVLAVRDLNGRTDVGLYVGGKLGSYPGVVAAVATPLAIAVLLLSGAFAGD